MKSKFTSTLSPPLPCDARRRLVALFGLAAAMASAHAQTLGPDSTLRTGRRTFYGTGCPSGTVAVPGGCSSGAVSTPSPAPAPAPAPLPPPPAPAVCAATDIGWSGVSSGCMARTQTATSGTTQSLTNLSSLRVGDAVASCQSGAWSVQGSCERNRVSYQTPLVGWYYLGSFFYANAWVGYSQSMGNAYCSINVGAGWTAQLTSSSYVLISANICNVQLNGSAPGYCQYAVSGSTYTGAAFNQLTCEAP